MSTRKCPECDAESTIFSHIGNIGGSWQCGSFEHETCNEFIQSNNCAYRVGYQAAEADVKSENRIRSDFECDDEELLKAWEDGYEAALDDLGVD